MTKFASQLCDIIHSFLHSCCIGHFIHGSCSTSTNAVLLFVRSGAIMPKFASRMSDAILSCLRSCCIGRSTLSWVWECAGIVGVPCDNMSPPEFLEDENCMHVHVFLNLGDV